MCRVLRVCRECRVLRVFLWCRVLRVAKRLKNSIVPGLPRLVTLCELYITKEVETATSDGIEKADIDVVGLLHLAEQHNADQLVGTRTNYFKKSRVLALSSLTAHHCDTQGSAVTSSRRTISP